MAFRFVDELKIAGRTITYTTDSAFNECKDYILSNPYSNWNRSTFIDWNIIQYANAPIGYLYQNRQITSEDPMTILPVAVGTGEFTEFGKIGNDFKCTFTFSDSSTIGVSGGGQPTSNNAQSFAVLFFVDEEAEELVIGRLWRSNYAAFSNFTFNSEKAKKAYQEFWLGIKPTQYTWHSVPSIGSHSLSVINDDYINDGEEVTDAPSTNFDLLEENTKLSALAEGHSSEFPVIESSAGKMTIKDNGNGTCDLRFYLVDKPFLKIAGASKNAYLSILHDTENQVAKPSIIYERVDFTADSEYLVDTKDAEITRYAEENNRIFYKTNGGKALCVCNYPDYYGYSGPILISTKEEAVSDYIYFNGSKLVNSFDTYSVVVDGVLWYICGFDLWCAGTNIRNLDSTPEIDISFCTDWANPTNAELERLVSTVLEDAHVQVSYGSPYSYNEEAPSADTMANLYTFLTGNSQRLVKDSGRWESDVSAEKLQKIYLIDSENGIIDSIVDGSLIQTYNNSIKYNNDGVLIANNIHENNSYFNVPLKRGSATTLGVEIEIENSSYQYKIFCIAFWDSDKLPRLNGYDSTAWPGVVKSIVIMAHWGNPKNIINHTPWQELPKTTLEFDISNIDPNKTFYFGFYTNEPYKGKITKLYTLGGKFEVVE